MRDNRSDLREVFLQIERILHDLNLNPNLPKPDFKNCNDEEGHFECSCNKVVDKWFTFIKHNSIEIDKIIIHSAFQFVFQDRKFLHDFHLKLAHFIAYKMDYIASEYPEYVTPKRRIKRQRFPVWLKDAVFHRDKGTCVICRCDLTKLIRLQNDINIDHIIPLSLYGTNDASNMQLLCSKCNSEKSSFSEMKLGRVKTPSRP